MTYNHTLSAVHCSTCKVNWEQSKNCFNHPKNKLKTRPSNLQSLYFNKEKMNNKEIIIHLVTIVIIIQQITKLSVEKISVPMLSAARHLAFLYLCILFL